MSRPLLATIGDDRFSSTQEVVVRDRHSDHSKSRRTGRGKEWPELSDRAFNILVAAALVVVVIIAVLMLALYP